MILNSKELKKITGGDIGSTLINSISRGVSTFLDLGRIIGSAVRRIVSGKSCSL